MLFQSKLNHSKLDYTKPNHIYTFIYNLMENSTVQLIFDLVDKSQKNIYRHCIYPNTNIFTFGLRYKSFGFNLVIFIQRFIKFYYLYIHLFFVWSWIIRILYILILPRIYLFKKIFFNKYLPVFEKYWQLVYTFKKMSLPIDI